jgi:hypothetical protein
VVVVESGGVFWPESVVLVEVFASVGAAPGSAPLSPTSGIFDPIYDKSSNRLLLVRNTIISANDQPSRAVAGTMMIKKTARRTEILRPSLRVVGTAIITTSNTPREI